MINTEASVSHDHDYCATNLKDEKDIDFVVDNLINSCSPTGKSMDGEIGGEIKKGDSLCLSPAYSCDSGIDSFANDLVQGFGGEGDDLLNFLLDDDFGRDFGLESEIKGLDKNFTTSCTNSSEGTAKVDKVATKTGKPSTGKTATTSIDEVARNRKNAENAKENRRKKKIYIEGLEKEVGQLRNEKNVLMGKSNRLEKKVNELENEVDYLKRVLANQSMLSKLIENVSKTPGVSLSTSFCSSRESLLKDNDQSLLRDNNWEKENSVSTRSASRKRACDSRPASNAKRSRGSPTGSGGGVCLHVKQSKVSIEFCHHCNSMAQD